MNIAQTCGEHMPHDIKRTLAQNGGYSVTQELGPFTVLRPPPSFPLDDHPASHPTKDVGPRDLKKPLEGEWRASWDDAVKEHERKDGKTALQTSIDTIQTWPTLALSQRPEVLACIGLGSGSCVEHYNILAHYWKLQPVTKPFQVSTDETIILRREGVAHCPGIDTIIDNTGGTCQSPLMVTSSSSRLVVNVVAPKSQRPSKHKRHDEISAPDDNRSQTPHLSGQHSPHPATSTCCTSPLLFTTVHSLSIPFPQNANRTMPSLSPFATCSPLSGLGMNSQTPQSSQCKLKTPDLSQLQLSTPTLAHLTNSPSLSLWSGTLGLGLDLGKNPYDALWESGRVFVPSSIVRWPDGMYACNIAKGFDLLTPKTGRPKPMVHLFTSVFPGIEFKSPTFYANWKVWRTCTEDERTGLQLQPRTADGTWVRALDVTP
ncbi:hypothetical protein C8Q80DRAFT_1269735 [Daedaleopsis nitida]|nr:hypothetical protein C8Q80DRAFT_1269735 [Daedaleopsis nitida]